MAEKNSSSFFTIKNLTSIFIFTSLLMAGAGAVVKISTSDLVTRVQKVESEVDANGKAIEKKVDKEILDLSLKNIQQSISDLKSDVKEQKKELQESMKLILERLH